MTPEYDEINRLRAKLFADFCQKKIASYTLRWSGSRIEIVSTEKIERTVIKLPGHDKT